MSMGRKLGKLLELDGSVKAEKSGGSGGSGGSAPLRVNFTATAGQTTKTGLTYTVGNIDCYLNGAKIRLDTDFTASDGVSVTFTPALDIGAEIELIMGTTGASSLGELTSVTVDTTDPLVTTNPTAVGHLWVNSTTGTVYICTDITVGANVWTNIGDGSGSIVPSGISGSGTVTTVGQYIYHTFTSSGTLEVSGSMLVDMLVVGGGGAGAGAMNSNSGGGGAGGYLSGSLTLASGTYNIDIGAGGTGAVSPSGTSGGNTTVSIINAIAIGGGHGGGGPRYSQVVGADGGSGGGGSGFNQDETGGSGTQGDSGGLTGYGNDGGSIPSNVSDGGGGAGGAGSINGANGHGGVGRQWVDNNYYAGGGGGGGNDDMTGGSGVGGRGGYDNLFDLNAVASTGSGGGGSWASGTTNSFSGGDGSTGIVIVRYSV
jgi:hypothetical protein